MKQILLVALAALLLAAGCQKSDKDRVAASLQNSAFFKALGAVPGQQGNYTSGGRALDSDSTWPISAARRIHDPKVEYEIAVNRPNADVDFTITWPCTLLVVYTHLPNNGVYDSVFKPAPNINGTMHWRFEFEGDSWKFTELSPCEARFDSAAAHITIDSLQIMARRAGQTITYPTLIDPQLRMLTNPYPYSFQTGDSVTLHLWETDDRQFVWAYLHAPYGSFDDGFKYDTTSHAFYGTWTVNQPGNHWVWFEAVDLNDAIISKTAPDRAILWGMPYRVE
jgi:hypothetical protein